jgi:hypothetical protein
VTSACQQWSGSSARKRFQDERGRLCGWGVTKPRRVRIRQIVETAGTFVTDGSAARWAPMVSAPASRPRLLSVLRSRTIRSSSSGPTARALVWGRRERGSNAVAPSVW